MKIFAYLQQFNNVWNNLPDDGKKPSDLAYLIFLGFLVGACAGIVIAVFRFCKDWAFTHVLDWAGSGPSPLEICLWFVILILAALITGRLIRNTAIRYGGGQWILDALADGQRRPWLRILAPKFLGSWLVLACGVSVGSEGPSIEMGAATALGLKNFDTKESIERRYFILGGCAAGLASAFSAPFAGICYVYEIMKEKMSAMLFVFLLSGAFGVYFALYLLFGLDVLMPITANPVPALDRFWLLVPLAIFAALAGVAYNYLLHFSIYAYTRQKRLPMGLFPLFPFIGAGIMLFLYPAASGEGLSFITEMAMGNWFFGNLCLFVLVKLLFTSYCYGSGIPAGLMVPIIAIGGVMGGIYCDGLLALNLVSPDYFSTMVIMGMGAAFAAAERAPVTAVVLISGMTGAFSLAPALLLVAALATLTARCCKVPIV